MPADSAISAHVLNRSVTGAAGTNPGSIVELPEETTKVPYGCVSVVGNMGENRFRFVIGAGTVVGIVGPNQSVITSAKICEKLLCPDTKSGKGGVTKFAA